MAKEAAEVFLLPDGCLYHLGIKEGELHPRIITVGEPQRARMIATELLQDVKEYQRGRSFLTLSGTYKDVPVSVVSIGMGAPNMAFLVMEASYLFPNKDLAFVRLGTCGIFNANYSPGTLFISERLYYCYKNYAHFDGNPLESEGVKQPDRPYLIAGPVEGDKELIDKLEANTEKLNLEYYRGDGVTAETFYSCQGRRFPGFGDENTHVVEDFLRLNIASCEMESHQLFHLCKQRLNAKARAASICLGVVSRVDPKTPAHVVRKKTEPANKVILAAAVAALEALISTAV